MEQSKARDKELVDLREKVKDREGRANQTTEKFWKIAIVIAPILGSPTI